MHKRQSAITNSYLSINDILNKLSDFYETSSHIEYKIN